MLAFFSLQKPGLVRVYLTSVFLSSFCSLDVLGNSFFVVFFGWHFLEAKWKEKGK